jgi:hypothetical protein
MTESNIVEGHRTLFYSHMAEGRAGHFCPVFPGLMVLIHGPQGLLRFVVRHVEKLDRIFDVMDPSSEEDRAVIVSCFVQKSLGSPEFG